VDIIGLPRNSCQVDFTINDDDSDDVNAFVDDELAVFSIDMAKLTNIIGDDGTPFFADTKWKPHQKA
jgi:hypothetical protein